MPANTNTLVTAPAVPLPGDVFVTEQMYATLPATQAAADPRTPESYLMRTGLQSVDQLHALLRRRPLSDKMASWLTAAVRRRTLPSPHPSWNACVELAAALPQTNSGRLLDILDGADRFQPGFDDAILAIVNHPDATDEVVAKALVSAAGAFGVGTVLEHRTAATGSLVPSALRLVHQEAIESTPTAWHLRQAVLKVADELNAAVGANDDVRRIVASVGVSWSSTRAELLEISRTIADTHT